MLQEGSTRLSSAIRDNDPITVDGPGDIEDPGSLPFLPLTGEPHDDVRGGPQEWPLPN